MKKFSISFLVLSIIMLMVVGFLLPEENVNKEYLRIHVRANSNAEIDQSVKYEVKDEVVKYLTPFIAECDTKQKAEKMLNDNLPNIEAVADAVLSRRGFNYKSNAKIANEEFPTRVYGELVLDGGFYDALILELGSGTGDNWWCVVYPPLCFTGNGVKYEYKSKILQVIDDFLNKKRG